ncbi:MAG TPA: phosphoglycerate dehydrogenase [Malonomonas sp.]
MYRILTHNKISVKGLDKFSRDKYEVASEIVRPDAIMLRSHQLTPDAIADSVTAIGRAGAGVNNIPVDSCTERGIVVFNAPRANANAVKELVLAGLLLCGRDILGGIDYLKQANGLDEAALHSYVEEGKKQFAGVELAGKTLGVVGLGAIGSLVAEAGLMLGMRVLGLDPALSVAAAWQLPRDVERIENMQTLLSRSDYVTLHLPVLEATRNLINKDLVASFKPGLVLLNFSREQLVDTAALITALDTGRLRRYVSDFPMPELLGRNDVVLLPHLGASTAEAEENCAIMIADQLIDFLADGNIKNSVNFPNTYLERSGVCRLAISNRNVPKMLGQILSLLADREHNVVDMINKSRGDIAYNLIDIEREAQDDLVPLLEAIDGVINARLL